MPTSQAVLFAHSIEDAADQLSANPELSILAGATWMMRAGVRHEVSAARHLSLARVAILHEVRLSKDEVSIGAMATHAQISREMGQHEDLQGLREAAQNSANPGVRQLATVGGNICANGFPAADLVPALLALNADVEVISAGSARRLSLAEFLEQRGEIPSELLTRIIISRASGRATHARLTMRAAGDYPVAIASIWQSDDLTEVRVALGSVEASARRWTEFEDAFDGKARGPAEAEQVAKELLETITGRDAVDAKGTYRARVLPSLIGRAFAKLDKARSEIS